MYFCLHSYVLGRTCDLHQTEYFIGGGGLPHHLVYHNQACHNEVITQSNEGHMYCPKT